MEKYTIDGYIAKSTKRTKQGFFKGIATFYYNGKKIWATTSNITRLHAIDALQDAENLKNDILAINNAKENIAY